MHMKTLIINGSPRVNGDTAGLLRILTAKLPGEYKVVDAYRCEISPCVDCRYCWKHPGCAVKDEMQEVYEYLEVCDCVLIASPVYFSELTGKVLDVGSRLQTYFCAKFIRKEKPNLKPKKGAVILVGGGAGAIDKAYETARTLLRLTNCKSIHPLVSSHDTDHVPAVEDEEALRGIDDIVTFFGEEDKK